MLSRVQFLPCLAALLCLTAVPHVARAQGDKSKSVTLTAEQCTEFRARFAKDSTIKGVHPAEAKQMVVPPRTPTGEEGKDLELRVLVNVRGGVDSVQVHGIVSSTYEDRLRTVMMRYNFKPATYQGCVVPFWMTFQVRS